MKKSLIICFLFVLMLLMALVGCGGGGGTTNSAITNSELVNMLVDGSSTEGFTGIASHIDTKVPFAGIPMYPEDVTLNPAILTLINTNVNNFLDLSVTAIFNAGIPPYPSGVTVDSGLKKISVTSGSVTISWTFAPNSVTRTYANGHTTSTYVYRTVSGQTSVNFDESVDQDGVKASYKGTATYQRDTTTNGVTKILGATFVQNRTETTSDQRTFTVNGTVTMGDEDSTPGNLAFSGSFSIYLPSYGQVSGSVSANDMTYLRGYDTAEETYYNSNLTDATAITFTSTTNYNNVDPITNPVGLQGIWSGTFTDGSASPGLMTFSVATTAYTWWGLSADESRFYGTTVKNVSDISIQFYDGAVLWGTGAWNGGTQITGTWSLNGRSGTFSLTKQ